MTMKPFIAAGLALLCVACGPSESRGPGETAAIAMVRKAEASTCGERAKNVIIVRDDWGIPHVRGKTDADAVFGLIYAQAEDDFNRIETNYLLSQGLLAEAEGEKEIWRDLRMRLFIDPADMKARFDKSPQWLKDLMQAWSDGLNYYLETHPQVHPRVIKQFEPWMALTFSEGSIGGDIERVSLMDLEEFYGGGPMHSVASNTAVSNEGLLPRELSGSNGFAIAPSKSASKHALLWINPHTSFFFRAEAQVTSEEGLNAYGALTWGQFFIYQGFNEHAGWMHTSSSVDNIDEYLETVTKQATDKGGRFVYKYGSEERELQARTVAIRFKTPTGMAQREFIVFRSHHGPIVRKADGKWVSLRLMEDPVNALIQSYSRTKANTLKEFSEIMNLHTNSSNNTVFADSQGNIAYFHANFVPRRDPAFDWSKPVDGSDPATEWHGVHTLEESPNVFNPREGWLYNTNNPPWTIAAADSPKRKDYPAYFDVGSENPRGIHAVRVLSAGSAFTPDSVIAAAFDTQLPMFDPMLPRLFKAYDAATKTQKEKLAAPIDVLKRWDRRWAADSVATSLAVYWGDDLVKRVTDDAKQKNIPLMEYLQARTTPSQQIESLLAAVDRLTADFGKWQTPWGEINRFQRISGDIVQPFTDSGPSIPVPFASGRWGSLATFEARPYEGSKKLYGTSGNSFLAIVEFGDKVTARAITAGGQSGDPKSRHFKDQAERYAKGDLRQVYFYPEQLDGHTERTYRPGE
jgi:acyl-homoserine-lactone acylase